MEIRIWIILTVSMLYVRLSWQDELQNTLSINTVPPTSQKLKPNNIANLVNDFGYKLIIKMMNEKKNDNIVVSPTGIAGLLSMALLGSVGRTFDELAEILGFSQDIFANRKNHEDFGELIQSLNSNVSSKTLYADAIFVDAQTPLRELYRNYIHDIYRGDVHNADFKQSQRAKDVINEWVKNHTEGQIDNFLKHTLPMSTKLVLLNALYFSGQWKQPFHPEYTAKMPFKKITDEVMADLMLNYGYFQYTVSKQHDFIMIALPYNDSETVMYALKPRSHKRISLLELMTELDYEEIDNTINEMKLRDCVVRFPKMELASTFNLEDTLKDMGLQEMFIPHSANFALMVDGNAISNRTEETITTKINKENDEGLQRVKAMLDNLPNPGIYVDAVIHDVKMSINEYGTEAVAATSAILARTADQFYADSPFYLFIRNERTKLVTFSAVIFDPTI